MLQQLIERMQELKFAPEPKDLSEYRAKAAVLIPIVNSADPQIILTQRSAHLSSHAGEIAFPGGKYDPEDSDLAFTALRETHEEIGVAPEDVQIIGNLSPKRSIHNLAVTPFVGLVNPEVEYAANLDELDTIFHVPLSYFVEEMPSLNSNIEGRNYPVPAYEYGEFYIWGLTAAIIVDLMNAVFDKGIPYKRRV